MLSALQLREPSLPSELSTSTTPLWPKSWALNPVWCALQITKFIGMLVTGQLGALFKPFVVNSGFEGLKACIEIWKFHNSACTSQDAFAHGITLLRAGGGNGNCTVCGVRVLGCVLRRARRGTRLLLYYETHGLKWLTLVAK